MFVAGLRNNVKILRPINSSVGPSANIRPDGFEDVSKIGGKFGVVEGNKAVQSIVRELDWGHLDIALMEDDVLV
ncbi:hypothetical protein PVK06_002689 [Gossypium arboreum]|uniref:Uncharacterized protein n=1 Tax=Gossypium arboreum TaxID=29729 RepID=A0ABR0R483_GOSAR|nr:hypothetical protein PVK06_002689 [Gossypium arboreum]